MGIDFGIMSRLLLMLKPVPEDRIELSTYPLPREWSPAEDEKCKKFNAAGGVGPWDRSEEDVAALRSSAAERPAITLGNSRASRGVVAPSSKSVACAGERVCA